MSRNCGGERLKKLWATPEFRAKMAAARKRSWEVHREKFIKAARDGMAKALKRPEFIKARAESTRRQVVEQWKDPAFRAARSRAVKKQWRNPDFRKKFFAGTARALIAQARGGPNAPERELYLALSKAGVQFEIQHRVTTRRSFTIADAFVPSANLLVYTDGIYWHSGKYAAKDKRVRSAAKRLGYRVFVIRQWKKFKPQFDRLLAAI